MAGPLSSEEIEDVVSSVRRLVSNEQKPRTLSRDLNTERLLLTPALRVVPDTSPLAPLVLDVPIAEPTAVSRPEAVPATEVHTEPDDSEAWTAAQEDSLAEALAIDLDPEPIASEGDFDDHDTGEAPFAVADGAGAEWEDEIWADPGVVSLGEAALAAEEAEILTASGPDDAEAEGPFVPEEDASGSWVADEPVPFVPLRRRAENLAARLAAGEVVDTPRPMTGDEIAGEEDAGTSPGAPATEPEGTHFESGNARMASEFLDEDGTPLAVLDEAALQEIVRQTLRSELQGVLGERITRNVRKLVRAEINRALMARDLD